MDREIEDAKADTKIAPIKKKIKPRVKNNTIVQEEKTLVPINPESLISKAIQKNVPIETMERLLAMRRELKEEWAREEYFKALSIFQQACPPIPKKKEVYDKFDVLRYRYAPLDVIIETIKDSAEENGFSHTVQARQEKDSVTAICTIHHKAGHSESSEFTIPIDFKAYMNVAQKVASALTYAKRYAFNNAFGIMTTDEDDDAKSLDDEYKTQTIKEPKPIEKPKGVENAPKGIKTVTTEIKIEGGQAKKQDEKVTEKDGNGKPPTTDPEKRKRGRPTKDTGTETAEKELPAKDSEAIKKEILKLDGQCASGLKIMKDNRFLTDQQVLEYEREINDYVKKGDVESLRGVYKDLKGLYFDTSKANQK